LCGRPRCPIQSRINAMRPLTSEISKTSLFGASPPAVFVGRWGYPQVSVGPMVPPARGEEARILDDPGNWYGKGIEEVIDMRSRLVRSNFRANVRAARHSDRLLSLTQELAMSSNPVDTEVWLKKPPSLRIRYDGVLSPMGPSGIIRDARLSENPSVSRDVEYVVSDYDLLASDALRELHTRGIDVYQTARLMTAGLLGVKKDRKLVPTRWAITAVDSNVSDHLSSEVTGYQELSEVLLFSAEYLGNHFEILLLPGSYSFELIEMWLPRSVWVGSGPAQVVADYEDWRPKSEYSPLGGGYYATRLAALEHLRRIRRQARVLAIREISPEYWAPLGVWVVRETARRALSMPPQRFGTVDEALQAVAHKFKVPRDRWSAESSLLRELREQLRLEHFARG
jgi:hypothetical protein